MKVPFNWLRDLFGGKLGGVSPEEVSYILSRQGIAVDQIHRLDQGLENVVVGHLNDVSKHPNADRLTVCRVNVGETESRTIVCGAKNHKAGDFVLVALPGANLPNGLFIKESPLRGVTSQGMICSREELGLPPGADPSENEGVIVLKGKQKAGTSAAEVLGLDDVVFELDITPNRGDCMSILGIARELAAGLRRELQLPKPDFDSDQQHRGEAEVGLEIVAPEECPFFTLQIIKGIKVGQSPDWMKQRLIHAGFHPINSIVDITNYVLFETGQPLHAYDLTKVKQQKFIVRRAKAGTQFKALDEKTYDLLPQDLTISDSDRVLCLAGVMGGLDSGITESTSDMALEAACFRPSAVRQTARRLGFRTESSQRFERGVDPMNCEYASRRAVELILKISGGTLLGGLVKAGVPPVASKSFNVDLRHYQRLIGVPLTTEQSTDVLKRLGVTAEVKSTNVIKVTPPSFRTDLAREVDIFEELARMMGYDQIKGTLPGRETTLTRETGIDWIVKQQLKHDAVSSGFSEAVLYAFGAAKWMSFFPNPLLDSGQPVPLKNPISEEMGTLRTSCLPGLLLNLHRNQRFGVEPVALFEQGVIFCQSNEPLPQKFLDEALKREDRRGVKEIQTLSFLMAGSRHYADSGLLWEQKKAISFDFYDFKGRLELFLEQSCGLKLDWSAPKESLSFLHPYQQCQLRMFNQLIGFAGCVHPRISDAFELGNTPVWVAELNMDLLIQLMKRVRFKFEVPSLFQKVERDAAFIVDRNLPVSSVLESLKKVKSPLLKKSSIFDVFEGQGVGEQKKSVALRFTFQSEEATLNDEQITEAFHECIEKVRTGCQAELRGSI